LRTQTGRILVSTAVLCAVGLIILFSIETRVPSDLEYIWIEAEDAGRIERPIEHGEDDAEASNGRFIQIRKLQRTGSDQGLARYDVDIPQPGEYVLWARVKWENGCGNSFVVFIGDEENKSHIGQDGIYDRWHWIRELKEYKLEKGENRIVFSGTEDGVRLDKILLTNNLDYVPQGTEQGGMQTRFSGAATSAWQFKTPGRWSQGQDPVIEKQAGLLTPSESPSEEFMLSSEMVSDDEFLLYVNIRTTQSDPAKRNYRIILDYRDDSNFNYIDFNFQQCRIVKRQNNEEIVLTKIEDLDLLNDNSYHEVIVERRKKSIKVMYDKRKSVSASDVSLIQGQIGIGSIYGGLYLEQIQYKLLGDIYYANNFYVVDDQIALDDWQPVSGLWWRSGVVEAGFAYGVRAESEVFSTTGEPFWSNYSARAAVKSKLHAGVGICVYYQDPDNYYLLRMADQSSTKDYAGKLQLFKVLDGERYLLREGPVHVLNDRWYDLRMNVLGNEISVFLDDVKTFTLIDSSLSYGKISLYMDPPDIRPAVESEIQLVEGAYWTTMIFDVPAEPGSDGMGIAFLYQNDNDYFLFKWNAESFDKRTSNKFQLIRIRGEDRVVIAEKEYMPYEVGKHYRLAVVAVDDTIQTALNNDLVFDVTVSDASPGRFGLYNGRGVDDAYFDDVEVEGLRSGDETAARDAEDIQGVSSPYSYHFVRPGSASRDLSAWRIIDGSWVISRSHFALVGQKEREQQALIWHKHPIVSEEFLFATSIRISAGAKPFIIIYGNGLDDTAGYKFTWEYDENSNRIRIQRNGKLIDLISVEYDPTKEFIPFYVKREGKKLKAFIFDQNHPLFEYDDDQPLQQNHLGIGNDGNKYRDASFSLIQIN
jgi:hypothetical protein